MENSLNSSLYQRMVRVQAPRISLFRIPHMLDVPSSRMKCAAALCPARAVATEQFRLSPFKPSLPDIHPRSYHFPAKVLQCQSGSTTTPIAAAAIPLLWKNLVKPLAARNLLTLSFHSYDFSVRVSC